MGHIYRNNREIPIPPDGRVNRWDMKVSVYRQQDGRRRRTVIGAATSETMMLPNDNFRIKYPDLWNEYYGADESARHRIRLGVYSACLSIGWRIGIYPALQEAFGPEYANAAMDFAMFSIRERSSTAQLFQDDMEEQMLFSRKCRSDTWYSRFFAEELTAKRIHDFKVRWLKQCAAEGTDEVWLCIDGSNNDCAATESGLVGIGHAKSRRDTNIVSYIWAVDAHSGRPVTWFVNNGAMHDAKAVDEVIRFLAGSDIKVKGVILDRGFVSQKVFDLLDEKSMSYIVMLKTSNYGFTEMMRRHASTIRWKVEHAVSAGLFGIVDRVKTFQTSPSEAYTALYFVGMKHATKACRLMDRIFKAADQIRTQIAENPDSASIPSGMSRYLRLILQDGKPVDVEYDLENWQLDLDEGGYHAIVSSDARSAKEIQALYKLRDVSEKQFCQLKSQLDGAVTRVHSDPSIEARFAVAFVASVLRTELRLTCEALELDVNEMIRKLDGAYLLRLPNGAYEEIHNHSTKCEQLFKRLGLTMASFKKFAEEVNATNPAFSEVRKMPVVELPRRPGRPKGSKNRATLEREAYEAAAGISTNAKPKRPRGRPKGSKNKSTLEREAAQAGMPEQPKRKPGRPKGSKNKATLAREAAEEAARQAAMQPKRKPGRPKGSKNKATLEREAREAEAARAMMKRGPGRPKGSKNRPKAQPMDTTKPSSNPSLDKPDKS